MPVMEANNSNHILIERGSVDQPELLRERKDLSNKEAVYGPEWKFKNN